jgi:hypothetical protein
MSPATRFFPGRGALLALLAAFVFSGGSLQPRVRLEAEGQVIHPLMAKPDPVRPLEFEIPRAAAADGMLTLTWSEEPGRGSNGRGCQVGEVWLIRAGE